MDLGRNGLRLQVRQLDDAHEKDGLLLGLRGAVLVRPDGHVAWRRPWPATDPKAELGAVLRTLLE